MNRHARRSHAKRTGSSPGGSLENIAEKLAREVQPHLEEMKAFSARMEEFGRAVQTIRPAFDKMREDIEALRGELALQREIVLQLIATSMGATRDEVLSMEEAIQQQLAPTDNHASKTPGPAPAEKECSTTSSPQS
jgi:protein subunit release factor A